MSALTLSGQSQPATVLNLLKRSVFMRRKDPFALLRAGSSLCGVRTDGALAEPLFVTCGAPAASRPSWLSWRGSLVPEPRGR